MNIQSVQQWVVQVLYGAKSTFYKGVTLIGWVSRLWVRNKNYVTLIITYLILYWMHVKYIYERFASWKYIWSCCDTTIKMISVHKRRTHSSNAKSFNNSNWLMVIIQTGLYLWWGELVTACIYRNIILHSDIVIVLSFVSTC